MSTPDELRTELLLLLDEHDKRYAQRFDLSQAYYTHNHRLLEEMVSRQETQIVDLASKMSDLQGRAAATLVIFGFVLTVVSIVVGVLVKIL